MIITGIIAEYNPFHNGHAYHIQETKKRLGSDYVIVVMSGNYVQRGAPTIIDKYSRTRMALESGADLVLELPNCFATASAEYFAFGGISILDKLNVVGNLCFGTESLDKNKNLQDDEDARDSDFTEEDQNIIMGKFHEIAELLNEEPKSYKDVFYDGMKQGLSYAAARSNGVRAILGDEYAEIIDTANNILAIEYLRSLKKLNSKLKPVPIPRMLASHHDTMITEGFSSATAIRNAIFNKYDFNSIADTVPESAFNILMDAYLVSFPIFRDDFSLVVGSNILMADSPDQLEKYFGIKREFANRIFNKRFEFQNFSQFRELIAAKNSNKATASRALMHIALETTKESMQTFLSYDAIKAVKVLGFRKESRPLLTEIKNKADINMVTKLADYRPDNPGLDMISHTTKADMVYRMVAMNKFESQIRNPFEEEVIII